MSLSKDDPIVNRVLSFQSSDRVVPLFFVKFKYEHLFCDMCFYLIERSRGICERINMFFI